MFGEVWINIDSVRSCEVPATFCKHFPYHNLNFIINSLSNKPVKKQPRSAINKRAATEHEDTSAFSSAGSLLSDWKLQMCPTVSTSAAVVSESIQPSDRFCGCRVGSDSSRRSVSPPVSDRSHVLVSVETIRWTFSVNLSRGHLPHWTQKNKNMSRERKQLIMLEWL